VPRLSFREKFHREREGAIVEVVNRLLAEKGFDMMTVDEVAAAVGIAKASIYKHFASKEALAAAAMNQVLDRALARSAELQAQPGLPALGRLKRLTEWALRAQLQGQMPALPPQNSALRAALLADKGYAERFALSDRLGQWIVQAQADGSLSADLPALLVLYTLYARACDPVPGLLRAGGAYDDEQIIGWVLSACFDGLTANDRRP
jgi:TetR/AcrR family transcriptional regulator, regulator of autoinduction and epiphytic fitness